MGVVRDRLLRARISEACRKIWQTRQAGVLPRGCHRGARDARRAGQRPISRAVLRDHDCWVDSKDFDIATSAPPETCEACFARSSSGHGVGVILVKHAKSVVEVATFRTEFDYQDGRPPERGEVCDGPGRRTAPGFHHQWPVPSTRLGAA